MIIKKFGAGEPETITEFAARHNLKLEVNERSRTSGLSPYSASLLGVEIMSGRGTLISTHGNGNDPDSAIADLAKRFAGQRIAIGAYTGERREIDVPNNFHHEKKSDDR